MLFGSLLPIILLLTILELTLTKSTDTNAKDNPTKIRQCFSMNNAYGSDSIKNSRILLVTMDEGSRGNARRRRTLHSWTIAEPLFVDEPQWILVDDIQQSEDKQQGHIMNKEDPFYVTRGKRSVKDEKFKNSKNIVKRQATVWDYLDGLNGFGEYVDHRNKRSQLLESILQEPFFVSRGKKSRFNNDQQIIENTLGLFEDGTSRDRRGKLVEQLLKEKDPFYVARGKRIYV